MAAPFRINANMFGNPRLEVLGQVAGYNAHEALGRWARAGAECTERQSYVLSEPLIAVLFGPRGVEALLAAELAERMDGGLRMLEMEGDIEWYADIASKRRRAGQARAATALRDERGRLLPSSMPSTAPARAGVLDQHATSTEPPRSSSLAPDLVPDPDRSGEEKNSAAPPAGGTPSTSRPKRRARKQTEPSEAELESVRTVLAKLSAQNGVRYSGTAEHTRLIVNQLRAGVSEMDLRAVIGFCADELGWKEDHQMFPYLRPETLFGPKTIAKYLDPARTWFQGLGRPRPAKDALSAVMRMANGGETPVEIAMRIAREEGALPPTQVRPRAGSVFDGIADAVRDLERASSGEERRGGQAQDRAPARPAPLPAPQLDLCRPGDARAALNAALAVDARKEPTR